MVTGKRIRDIVGDVHEIVLKSGGKRYLQYLGFDKSTYGFGGDVVRVFKKTYQMEATPTLEEICQDEVDFFAHIHRVSIGTKEGLWSPMGNMKENTGNHTPLFYAHYAAMNVPDMEKEKWILWEMDGKDWEATKDEILKTSADMGGVMPPKWIEERIQTGKYQITDPAYIK